MEGAQAVMTSSSFHTHTKRDAANRFFGFVGPSPDHRQTDRHNLTRLQPQSIMTLVLIIGLHLCLSLEPMELRLQQPTFNPFLSLLSLSLAFVSPDAPLFTQHPSHFTFSLFRVLMLSLDVVFSSLSNSHTHSGMLLLLFTAPLLFPSH